VKEMNKAISEMPALPDKLETKEEPVLLPSSSGLYPPSASPTGVVPVEATAPVILPTSGTMPAGSKPVVP
jgi:hypothetical protein